MGGGKQKQKPRPRRVRKKDLGDAWPLIRERESVLTYPPRLKRRSLPRLWLVLSLSLPNSVAKDSIPLSSPPYHILFSSTSSPFYLFCFFFFFFSFLLAAASRRVYLLFSGEFGGDLESFGRVFEECCVGGGRREDRIG